MSALQALERVCDQIFSLGLPADRIVAILMEGCENLAMPALVVGLLVRHIESAGTLLDPFLAEPHVWQLEFSRTLANRWARGEFGGIGDAGAQDVVPS